MRVLTIVAVLSLVLGAPAIAATPDVELTAPIHQFIDAFNKGDAKTAAAAHTTTDLAILDEIPPHIWQGPGAFTAWSSDLAADAKKRGLTDESVTLGEPTRTEVSGARAYVVVPAIYAFKDHGVPMRESAQMTFALRNDVGGWRIAAWTWTGPRAQPAPAPAKP